METIRTIDGGMPGIGSGSITRPALAGGDGSETVARRFGRVLPLAFITYSLAFLDRVNYSFGIAGGMKKDLGINANMESLLAAMFFFGYFLSQIPGAAYASHRSARKLIFVSLLSWGLLSGLTGVVSNVPLLLGIRFMLGVVEGVVLPGMLVYLTHWFTKAQRSRANTFLILGNPVTMIWASMISGFVIKWIAAAYPSNPSSGWRGMFIVEGFPSILWAFGWLWLARDYPREAGWMSEREARELESAIENEQKSLKPVKNYREAFTNPRTMILSAQYFCQGFGLYGFGMWLPKLLKEVGFTVEDAGMLSAGPWVAAVIFMLAISWASDRSGKRKPFVWPCLLCSATAFLVSAMTGAKFFWVSYVAMCIAGGMICAWWGPFWAMIPEMIPKKVAAESMAMINSLGALGGFVGTYLVGWVNEATGTPMAGMVMLAGSMALAGVLVMAVRTNHAN